jgi:hydrogenase/urease accessory protein HupE
MRARLLWCVALLVALVPRLASGHELMPAYLEIRQTGPDTYDILLKAPAQGAARLPVEVVLPRECVAAGPVSRELIGDAWFDRWSVRCEGGLVGRTVRVEGLNGVTTDAMVRVRRLDGSTQLASLKPYRPSFVLEASPTLADTAVGYLRLGVQHILGGVDHLLFVVGLLFIVRGRATLVKTITAFTVAHSLTLGATTLGLIYPDGPTLNVLIAMSILFLGPEIVRVARGETSLTIRRPWLVAFAFGLLHGFGFAGGLSAIGVPRDELVAALLAFNVGVEVGQLGFVAVLLALAVAARVLEFRWSRWQRLAPGYVVGSLGAGWTVGRLIVLLGIGGLA